MLKEPVIAWRQIGSTFASLLQSAVLAGRRLMRLTLFWGASLRERLVEHEGQLQSEKLAGDCLLYTSPSPRDQRGSRMPSSA